MYVGSFLESSICSSLFSFSPIFFFLSFRSSLCSPSRVSTDVAEDDTSFHFPFSPLFEWAVNYGWLVEEKSWGGEGEGKEGGLADFHG